ncbi:hypothetical protein [Xanthomonas pisi]|uniref:Leucine-rich repeat domain-containing protein n=1 Tax=Xanthomonas pisi TaxID=56457 RepID=A0A2S7D8T6_9XANT|nr:hypothetical protein [Xanthomonas pisi]KLD70464.1 hypothetical protein Y887_11530 [Xanthomonas pisi DSM 18956]PPU70238.1 hypothetical protein XpiCFBP4643_01370 [Xanthomonas pisi]
MTETLFEADERTMENLMEGPWASIEGKTHGLSRRTALFNKSGFEKYSHLIDAYGCDGFSIAPEDVVQGELKAHFSPDFSKVRRREAIVEIGILGNSVFAEDFDYDVFKSFSNVKGLTTQNVSFGPILPTLFPALETWQSLDWKSNKLHSLNGSWTKLARLSVHGFSGSLDVFDDRPIRKLFLISSTIKKIDEIARCTSLEVLQFVACRLTGDVSSLSRLAQLRALRLEGKNTLQGWESLYSETLRNFWATDLPCRFRPEQFPHIENYVINTYRNKDPFRMVVGDPDEIEEAFASIFTE